MFSAFTAQPVVELKQGDKSRIESILAYRDRLLVGLNTGTLRIYRVNDVAEDGKQNGKKAIVDKPRQRSGSTSASLTPTSWNPVDLLRELETFSTKSVEQLALLKDANNLMSLSNSYVSIHNLQSYTLQVRLEETKGATAFAVTSNIVEDTETGIASLLHHSDRVLLTGSVKQVECPDPDFLDV